MTRNVAILIFDEVEVLDFCGPFEVFSVAATRVQPAPFNVYTVAEKSGPILARGGLSVNPRYTTADCPPPDILLVPGGYGTRREVNNAVLVSWVGSRPVELMLSVCTGALILAKAGLLDGLSATTHHSAFDELRELAPNTTVYTDKRFVDNGSVVLSAGVSAGIDMALHVVTRLLGADVAEATAQNMEYDWQPEKWAVGD